MLFLCLSAGHVASQTLLWLKSPSCHQPGPAVTLPPDSAACGVCQRCTRTATVSLMVAGPGQSPTSAHPPCEALTLQEKRPATQQHEGRPPTPPRADRWTRGRGVPPGPAPPRPAHFRPCSFHRIPPAGYLRCTQSTVINQLKSSGTRQIETKVLPFSNQTLL